MGCEGQQLLLCTPPQQGIPARSYYSTHFVTFIQMRLWIKCQQWTYVEFRIQLVPQQGYDKYKFPLNLSWGAIADPKVQKLHPNSIFADHLLLVTPTSSLLSFDINDDLLHCDWFYKKKFWICHYSLSY